MQAIGENTGFLFAHGERILKVDTKYERVYENGALTERRVTVLGYTVYPFPQVVLDGAVFTKHYFAGTMRFATQVSPEPADRFLASASRPLSKRQRKDALHYARKAGLNLVWAKTTTKPKARPNGQRPAAQVYFYHPDHLGTATLLTDIYGTPYQLFLNLPFGEEMAAQHAGGAYATRYKFNGKELDPQTGYYYYGARYCDPVVSRWLSIDPLAEKYPGLSPYNYTANNPVMLVDPDGKIIKIHYKGNDYVYKNGKLYFNGKEYTGKIKGYLKKTLNALNKLRETDDGKSLVDELTNSKNVFIIKHSSKNKGKDAFIPDNKYKAYALGWKKYHNKTYQLLKKKGIDFEGGSGGVIYWNPSGVDLPTTNGSSSFALSDLTHEMVHAVDADNGELVSNKINGIKISDWRATYHENLIRKAFGEPLRTHYGMRINEEGKVIGGLGTRILDKDNKPILPEEANY